MSAAEVKPGYKVTEVGVIPEDWEVEKIGDMFEVAAAGDLDPSRTSPTQDINFAYPIYSNALTNDGLYGYASYCLYPPNSITITARGNLGNAVYRDHPYVAIGRVIVLKPTTELDGRYFAEFINSHIDFAIESTGVPQLTAPQVGRYSIPLPPLPEQRAIAAALGDVDALLAALERLIAKRRAVKQAAMDALLSGRVRLPGFGQGVGYRQTEVGEIPEDWEARRIGELFDFLSTSSCSRGDLDETGDVYYIHYGDIHTKWNYKLDFDQEAVPQIRAEKVRNADLLRDGDLILVDASEDEEGAGKGIEIINLNQRRAVSGLHTIALRPKGNDLANGFKAYIQAMQPVKLQIRRLVTGLKVFGISKTSLESVAVPLPSLPEQHAIAEVLSDMDAALAALERQRAKVQALKQGMMAELLTGRVRLVK